MDIIKVFFALVLSIALWLLFIKNIMEARCFLKGGSYENYICMRKP